MVINNNFIKYKYNPIKHDYDLIWVQISAEQP